MEDSQNQPHPPARRAAEPVRRRFSWTTGVGLGLILVGLMSLGWVGWQYYGTNFTANADMKREVEELTSNWKSGPEISVQSETVDKPTPVPGDAMALLRIPKLGDDYVKPIIAGTGEDELARGVGWYPNTAQPGQLGNFAIAGHRITHGEPFAKLLTLEVGDLVEVETRDAVYVYEMVTPPRDITVTDNEGGWVLEPNPRAAEDKRGGEPRQALITLTTCTDLFASPQRSVGFGILKETRKK